jgi:hypothetical protein
MAKESCSHHDRQEAEREKQREEGARDKILPGTYFVCLGSNSQISQTSKVVPTAGDLEFNT